MKKNKVLSDVKRMVLIVAGAFIMALNIKSFVRAGGLLPGGFNGLTLLIQQISEKFFNFTLPFSLVNFALNAVPAVISYKHIGKKFT